MYGDIEIYVFTCPSGVSGLTLNLMPWACKGYTSTSEIKTFDSNVKQKGLNDEKR